MARLDHRPLILAYWTHCVLAELAAALASTENQDAADSGSGHPDSHEGAPPLEDLGTRAERLEHRIEFGGYSHGRVGEV